VRLRDEAPTEAGACLYASLRLERVRTPWDRVATRKVGVQTRRGPDRSRGLSCLLPWCYSQPDWIPWLVWRAVFDPGGQFALFCSSDPFPVTAVFW
jgi:hypothetical protein